MGVGLMRSLQPPDILWIHWRVYNFIVNTSKRVLFLPSSDASVRSFLYLLYTLIKLYYTKALSVKPRLWPRIEFFSSGGQESRCIHVIQQQPFKTSIFLQKETFGLVKMIHTHCKNKNPNNTESIRQVKN